MNPQQAAREAAQFDREGEPGRSDSETESGVGMYCITCGAALFPDPALVGDPRCPRCTRPYNPEVRGTWTVEPEIEPLTRRWFQNAVLARWSLLPLVLLGRILINVLGYSALGSNVYGSSQGRGIASLFFLVVAFILALPWAALSGLCFLIALEDRFTFNYSGALLALTVFYAILMLGYPVTAFYACLLLVPLLALLYARLNT
jgi:hypothetical protein